MRIERLRFQLGMELHADEPGMVGTSTISGSTPSGDMPEKTQAGLLQPLACSRC